MGRDAEGEPASKRRWVASSPGDDATHRSSAGGSLHAFSFSAPESLHFAGGAEAGAEGSRRQSQSRFSFSEPVDAQKTQGARRDSDEEDRRAPPATNGATAYAFGAAPSAPPGAGPAGRGFSLGGAAGGNP
jgi:hypothetical protein